VDPKGHTTANMVLGPFPERKGPRLPGRNPATPNIFGTLHLKKECDEFLMVESPSLATALSSNSIFD
jgi:hypothetical protein